jgi:hypothetical protein
MKLGETKARKAAMCRANTIACWKNRIQNIRVTSGWKQRVK